MSVENKVLELAKTIAEELNYELVDIEYVKEGKNWFLRLYIDQPSGISLDDCTKFSERLSEKLDEKPDDFMPHAYYLEVSSPGAERPLNTDEDINNAIGKYIYVKLYNMIGINNSFEGHLKEVTDDSIIMTVKVKTRKKDIEIKRNNISKARLAIEF